MAREQKRYGIYNMVEYLRSMESGNNGDDICAVAVVYAKTCIGALRSFEQGMHSGSFMLVWDGGSRPVLL